MICCVIVLFWLFIVLLWDTCSDPRVFQLACLIIAAYLLSKVLFSVFGVSKLSADEAAGRMFAKSREKQDDLESGELSDPYPDFMKGVFWFKTNAAPELLMTFEGSPHFKNGKPLLATCCGNSPYVNLNAGGYYNWAYSADKIGWMYWLALRMTNMMCAELHINFQDDTYEKAWMPLYFCGVCPDKLGPFCCDGIQVPFGMRWGLNRKSDADCEYQPGNEWARPIYLYLGYDCCGGCGVYFCDGSLSKPSCACSHKSVEPWELGSYDLVRIIDENGERIQPQFDDMMKQLEEHEKVKGLNSKPVMQIVNAPNLQGNVWGSSCCVCFMPAGNEEYKPMDE